MEHDRARWRFRHYTLMLWVIILALALTLVIDRWKREQERRRLAAEEERAVAEFRQVVDEFQSGPQRAKRDRKALDPHTRTVRGDSITRVAT